MKVESNRTAGRPSAGIAALMALLLSSLAVIGLGAAPADAAAAERTADFNGDGYDELVVGAPGERVGGRSGAGAVHVIYGANTGLSTTKARTDQTISQDTGGINDAAETNDGLGSAVTTGDFNRDGYDDLAVGVPFEDSNGKTDSGSVHIVYGSAVGLSSSTTRSDQLYTQDTAGVNGVSTNGGNFGHSLIGADFNNDGYSDLAIGSIGMTVSGRADAGAVHVLYGSSSGLSTVRTRTDQYITQALSSVNGSPQTDGLFGFSLAAGDLNNDNWDDLIIGASGMSVSGQSGAGAVHVIYGSWQGVSTTLARSDQYVTQSSGNVNGTAQESDHFGGSVASGDLNGDGYDELIIGVPFENIGSANDAGALHVFYGSSSGASTTATRSDQFFHQDISYVNDTAEAFDRFAWSITAGDLNNDSYDDLIIGVRAEGLGSVREAGAVQVIYGSRFGASARNTRSDQFWQQGSNSIQSVKEAEDGLGWAVSTGDFNGDGRDDLVAGAAREGIGSASRAGAVHVIYGASTGASSAARADQFWYQGVSGLNGSPGSNALFGSVLG